MNRSVESLFKELLNKFDALDKNDINAINDFLDEYSLYFERGIFVAVNYNNCTGRDYLNKKIIDLLNTKIDSFSIGDMIIRDCLIKGKKINSVIFYYDALRCFNELYIDNVDISITFNEKNNEFNNGSIVINLGDKTLYKDGDITNLLNLRKAIKTYDQMFNRDNKNELENLYNDISIYLDKLDIDDKLDYFIPNNYDKDLYSFKSLNDLLISFEDSRLDRYIEELISYSKYRDVNSEDNFIIINGLDINGINEEVLSKDYVDRYMSNEIDNRTLEQNGYDKANLLPFIYLLIDYFSMGLRNNVFNDSWDNYKNLYEIIIRSQEVLKEFPLYNDLIKDNKLDDDDKLKEQFISYKLFDIYQFNSSLVEEWANTNYIEDCEYNSDYYIGDMKSELDTMYLNEYLNRNKVNNKKK